MEAPTPRAKKRLGQHFLHDARIIDRIVGRFAPRPGQAVVEIGPGAGALTAPLLDSGADLTVVEFDRDMADLLEQRFSPHPRFHLVRGDVLRYDFPLADGRPLRVIGNLPYNISSPILFHLLDCLPRIADMYFMLQLEVVARVASTPGGRDYGRPSVMIQRLCEAEAGLRIPPGAFRPPPRVESAMLTLRPRATPVGGEVDPDRFARIVAAAFATRRKTLRNALRKLVDAAAFEAAGIDPSRRAETLSVEEFVHLVQQLPAPETTCPG